MALAQAQITLFYIVDIYATYRYYILQSSTLSKPSKPTTYPPDSSWDDTEPTYTSGSTNSLYYVDLTVFSDDTFSYSEVSLSTAYEAAKEAWNKAQNAQDTADSAQEDIDNLEVGGRNLILETGTTWQDFTCPNNDTSYETNRVNVAPGETYTVGFDIKSEGGYTGNTLLIQYYTEYEGGRTSYEWVTGTVTTEYTRIIHTFVIPSDINYLSVGIRAANDLGYSNTYSNIKLEKGNIATDWTPAPEDVEQKIDDSVDLVQTQIVEYSTSIISDCESIVNSAIANYVTIDEFNETTESIESNLTQTAENITATFSSSITEITNVLNDTTNEDGETEAGLITKFTEYQKYITFDENGITISDNKDGGFKINIDNEEGIQIYKGDTLLGLWDGTDFFTGNIHVRVEEQARFGNFAFLPREDGSLMFLKVGDSDDGSTEEGGD